MSHAATLKGPYFRVTLDSPKRGPASRAGLTDAIMEEMISIAPTLDGFLGLETHWKDNGRSVTVCYWSTQAAIQSWRQAAQGRLARVLRGLSLEQACRLKVTEIGVGWGRVLPFLKKNAHPPVITAPEWTRRANHG